jgi:hypothetical protein
VVVRTWVRTGRFALPALACTALVVTCGAPEQSPEVEIVPATVGMITSVDETPEGTAFLLEDGTRFEYNRDSTQDPESTGVGEAGDLLVAGAATQDWVAILGPADPLHSLPEDVWVALPPAWIDERSVLFDSGLRLERHPDFTIGPSAQKPTASGYVYNGQFMVTRDGRVMAFGNLIADEPSAD